LSTLNFPVQAGRLIAEELNHVNYMDIALMAEKYKAAVLVEAVSRFIMAKAVKAVNWDRLVEEMPCVSATCMKISQKTIHVLMRMGLREGKEEVAKYRK
jgi:hypothetical protein